MSLRLNRRHVSSEPPPPGAVAASLPLTGTGPATAFTMQAAWINDAEFAGYFLGIDEGYYAEMRALI